LTGTTVTGTTASFTSGVFTNISGTTATITSGIIASGTAAAPSLAILADLDTGLFSPGANELAVATNGTQRLFVDASGRLLVGTSASPSAGNGYASKFVVAGNAADLNPESGAMSISRTGILFNSGDTIGSIAFTNPTGNAFAAISCAIDATPGVSDFPGRLTFSTTPDNSATLTERLRITSAGLVGIGTTTPGANLQIGDGSSATLGSTAPYAWVSARALSSAGAATTPQELLRLSWQEGDQNLGEGEGCAINFAASLLADSGTFYPVASIASFKETDGDSLRTSALTFSTSADGSASPTERLRIDSSGRLLSGTSTARSVGGVTQPIQQESTSDTGIAFVRNSSGDILGSYVILAKSRGGSVGSNTVVQSGDQLGALVFAGADGTDVNTQAAVINAFVDGTPGPNDMPGRLAFSTTAAGDSSPTERMSITSAGDIATSGDLLITNNFPAIRLTESDGTATHSQTSLTRNSNQFTIQTRDSTATLVSSDYLIPSDASGATDHLWRIANTEKLSLDSTGLTVVDDLTISDKIIHAGDPNTAIRFPAADTVSVETNGIERLSVDSSGLQVVNSLYITDKIVHTGDTNTAIRFPAADTVTIETSGTERLRISSDGRLLMGGITPSTTVDHSICTPGRLQSDGTYSITTASSANVVIQSSGLFLRSTSSIKYKTEVEDAELSYSEALVYGSRPVWYRSLSESDPSDYSYWGFIAEEVAEIDPRMVHWGDDGPEGVQYDRYVVHLVGVIQKQQQRLDALEARIAALEAEVAALKAQ
jgi:hypothetical protein